MKKYILLCSFICIQYVAINSMNTAAQLVSKGVTGLSTLVHFGYFAPQALGNAVPFHKFGSNFTRPTDEKTKEFVKNALKEAQYPPDWIEKITISIGNPSIYGFGYVSDTDAIFTPIALDESIKRNNKLPYPPYIQWEIDELDTKMDPQMLADYLKMKGVEDEPYTCAKGILVHEAGHVYHNHPLKNALKTIFSVGAIHAVSKKLADYMDSLQLMRNPTMQSLCKSALRLGIGLPLKIATTVGLITLERRRQEKEADQEVINRVKNPQILKELAQGFDAVDQYDLMNATEKYGNWIIKYPNVASFLMDANHPRAQKRANRFKKRVEELRKINEVQKIIKNL